jgi:hypothetical protein
MSRYKTEEQKSAFGVGILVISILHGGFDVFRIEGWGPYVGIPMILFSVICAYQYTKDDPKNKII